MKHNLYLNNGSRRVKRFLGAVLASAMVLSFGLSEAQAQTVGISTSTITPSANSMLEVRATNKGILIPRMTEAQRLAINGGTLGNSASDDTERGMLVYQYNNTAGYYYWNGTTWVRLLDAGSAGGWLTSGNAATVPGTNYIGTTDNVDLRIKTNNIDAFDVTASGRLHAYQNGSAASPVISWNTDNNMGIFRANTDILAFSTNGVEAMRIDAGGNVGIGLTTALAERLEVDGNIRIARTANRSLYMESEPTNLTDGKTLTVRAGAAMNFGSGGQAHAGGDLIIQAGTGHVAGGSMVAGGDLLLRAGTNYLTATGAGINSGDVLIQTGGPTETFVDRLSINGVTGVVKINTLAGSGNRLVLTDNLGNISIGPDPTTFGTGTVTSIATGTGLTGGPITASGTISMADMAALSVKGNATNATAAPTDVAAGTDHQVLRRSGTSLGFGAVNLAQSAAVTGLLQIANGGTNSSATPTNGGISYGTGTAYAFSAAGTAGNVLVSGGAGAPTWSSTSSLMADLTMGTGLSLSAGTTYDGSTALTINIANDGVTSTQILNGTVANADLANMAAYTVKGNFTNAAAAPADNAASADGQVLRRASGALGFSAMPITDLTGTNNTVYYVNNSGVFTSLALGGAGTVLQSNGAGVAPTFVAPSSLNANLTVTNGLRENTASAYNGSTARNIKLGGPLVEATTIDQAGFAFSLGGDAVASAISIGTGGAVKTLTLGSTNTTSTTNIVSGSGAVNVNVTNNQPTNINTGTSTGAVSVGSNTGAQAITVRSGATGTVSINASTGGNTPVSIASGTTTGNVEIGNASGFVGIGGAVNASYKLTITGKVKSTGINETSDERLKVNFASIDGALAKVLSMAGKYYDWRIAEFPNLGLSEGRQIGVIAQEMEKILPEVVTTGEDGYKAVEYSHIVPVLIEAIKEQQAIIDAQQTQLTSLKGVQEQVEMLKASVELLNEHIRTSNK